jgi:hypothetical protein
MEELIALIDNARGAVQAAEEKVRLFIAEKLSIEDIL